MSRPAKEYKVGKRHPDVRRDIRNMLEALGKDVPSFGAIYQDAYGRDQTEYRLDRELTMTLVSGYDIPLRHRVVVKLAELEQKVGVGAMAIPKTLPEALRLAADMAEQQVHVEAKLALAKPNRDIAIGTTSAPSQKEIDSRKAE